MEGDIERAGGGRHREREYSGRHREIQWSIGRTGEGVRLWT